MPAPFHAATAGGVLMAWHDKHTAEAAGEAASEERKNETRRGEREERLPLDPDTSRQSDNRADASGERETAKRPANREAN